MTLIKYTLHTVANRGTKNNPKNVDVFNDVKLECLNEEALAANIEIAKKEAYKGEYTVEEIG